MAIDPRRVVSTHPPYIPITLVIEGQAGALEFEALIDTGFDGDVIVPPTAIADSTEPVNDLSWRLGDGSEVSAPSYSGDVWIGSLHVASVVVTALGSEPVIGRGITSQFTVIFDHDRRVIVEP